MTTASAKKPVMLCVDDEQSILNALKRLFFPIGLDIELATNGQDALKILEAKQVHLIISDMRMPEMNGAEFLAKALEIQPDAYRILMTGYSDMASTIAAINDGRIHRYVQKPWNNKDLLNTVKDGLKLFHLEQANKRMQQQISQQNKELKELNHSLEEMVHQRTAQLKKTLAQLRASMARSEQEKQNNLDILYNVISIHPLISAGFAVNVSNLAKAMAEKMQLPAKDIENVALTSLLHEIGMIGLPADLLKKPYHQLEGLEKQQFMEHASHAELILSPAPHLRAVVEGICCQYAHFNGTGYPANLKDTHIPLPARILAVARDYWLLMTRRSYSKVLTPKEACTMIVRASHSLYDPAVINAFEACYQKSRDIFINSIRDGYSIDELKPGMRLRSALYNETKILLLPKGCELTPALIDKLKKYQRQHHQELKIDIAPEDTAATASEAPAAPSEA